MSRIGRNVLRGIGIPAAGNDITSDIDGVRRFGQTPTLQRAIVIDVVIDPNLLTDDQIDIIKTSVNNPEFASIMPVNSIIARIVSNSQGRVSQANTILFPFFSSHFMLPVQPGEMVEVIYDDYFGSGNGIGYWVTRTSSERTIEDPNYTHFDRRFDLSMNPSNFSTSERSEREADQPVPGFPNGGNTPETLTLATSSSMDRPYERIVREATAYLNSNNGLQGVETDGETPLITPEPVPRWRKRPQEFVLQGANNTLICLGEDRKGGPLGALVAEEGQQADAKTQAGTIDIVAGRGRVLPSDASADPEQQRGEDGRSPTSPLITENTRGNTETDKAPYRRLPGESRLKDNAVEGDPDFVEDAARLYVSMQSEADVNFGLTEIEYTEDTTPIVQPNEGAEGTINKSYVVGKADHIRLIARSDLSADSSRGIDGTIAIIREGVSEDEEDGLGLIYIDKTGIQIDAPRINLGRGLADLAGAGGDPTPGGEPYIRWSKFRDTVDRMQEEIEELRDFMQQEHDKTVQTLNTIATILDAAFKSAVAIPFTPVASLQAIGSATAITQQITALQGQVNALKTQAQQGVQTATNDTSDLVSAAQSTKIFGE